MGYIGAHGVAALHRHKYSGVDHSYVAKYILQPFWTRCVNFFPLWMPPNVITLTGFTFLFISALLGYNFDAVDGKQARRTNSSSPLGELFDHGCDALACALWLLVALQCVGEALSGSGLFQLAVPFYGATWEKTHEHSKSKFMLLNITRMSGYAGKAYEVKVVYGVDYPNELPDMFFVSFIKMTGVNHKFTTHNSEENRLRLLDKWKRALPADVLRSLRMERDGIHCLSGPTEDDF